MPALETGSVDNWEETLAEMNDKLKAAGIDDVLLIIKPNLMLGWPTSNIMLPLVNYYSHSDKTC
jgi:hypothetical protein